MKHKKLALRLIAAFMAFVFTTTNAFADVNMGSELGDGFKDGTSDNVWGVDLNDGTPMHVNGYNDFRTEGLRVTVYNADTNQKVSNTIDITGCDFLNDVTFRYFSDNGELIPKTTWLKRTYIGGTYNAADSTSKTKYNSFIATKYKTVGYRSEYIPELAELTIISENNTAHLEQIKAFLGDEEFLKSLCTLLSGDITYEDIIDGKYKIAFEPVAYFRYNGMNWALTATEVAIYNKYLVNIGFDTGKSMCALLGPLTHCNLPRAAFLERRDLGISVYSPNSTADYYYSWRTDRNSDNCIIRTMGIGVLTATPEEEPLEELENEAAYHTDIDVYTSFEFENYGENIVGDTVFSLKNANTDEYPKKQIGPLGEYVLYYKYGEYNPETEQVDFTYRYAYNNDTVGEIYCDSDDAVEVFIDNPDYDSTMNVTSQNQEYKSLGKMKDGDYISAADLGMDSSDGVIKYTVRGTANKHIASGTISNSCPSGETAMGWFDWHTPTMEQTVTITIEVVDEDSGIVILDENGDECLKLKIKADIQKVEEVTPPDPKVTDRQPSWHTIMSDATVAATIAQYAPVVETTELTWYTWSCTAGWAQQDLGTKGSSRLTDKFKYIDPSFTPNPMAGEYAHMGADVKESEYDRKYWGVNNGYYYGTNGEGDWCDKFYTGAVILTVGNWQKVEMTASITAEAYITPSEHCYTAVDYGGGEYEMKSGYGFEISVDVHLSGSTELCTGSQTVNTLFPEFNYDTRSGSVYNRLLVREGDVYVFKENPYSTYSDRVHFTPIWYPDEEYYTVFVEVFDIWCPAGHLSVRLTDDIYIDGNVYDDWHIAPVNP